MSPDDLFSLASTAAMAGWAILLFAPRRWPALDLVPALIIPAGLSALYAVLILRHLGGTDGGFGSLPAVAELFSNQWLLLAGWVHYLAFDLAVGAWSARRMDGAGVARVVQAPLLLAVFMVGPLGFLLVLVVIGAMRFPAVNSIAVGKEFDDVLA